MSETIARGTAGYWRASMALFLAAFSVFAAIYCVQPLLPVFVEEYGLEPATSSIAISATTATLAVSLMLISWLGNRFDRKLLMAATLTATSALVFATAATAEWGELVVFRSLIGVAVCGVPAVAMVYLGEEMDPAALGFGMGMFVGGSAIGGMGGRLIMGLLLEFMTWREALMVVGWVIVCNTLAFLALLPVPRNSASGTLSLSIVLANMRQVVSDPALRLLLVCSFILMGIFVAIYNYIAFRLLASPYDLSQSKVALVFVVYLVGTVASTVIGSLAGAVGRRKVLWTMMVVILIGLAVSLADPLWAVVVGMATATFGFFGAHSVASAWVAHRSGLARPQGSALYLLAYYAGSSILGTVAGLGWSYGRWPGVVALCALFASVGLMAAIKLAFVPPVSPTAGSFSQSAPLIDRQAL